MILAICAILYWKMIQRSQRRGNPGSSDMLPFAALDRTHISH
jgi:hypothetical protein